VLGGGGAAPLTRRTGGRGIRSLARVDDGVEERPIK